MTRTDTIRERSGIFSKVVNVVGIEGVKPTLEDAIELYRVINRLRSRKEEYELYVRGEGAKGISLNESDYFDSIQSVEHFLAGYELAMLFHGFDVRAGLR